MKGNPDATVFRHQGRDQPYVFVRGDEGTLEVCYWNAAPNVQSWQWADLGRPGSARVNSSPDALTSVQDERAGEHFLHGFVRGNDGDLYEKAWNGSSWLDWLAHGRPHWNVAVTMGPGVQTDRRAFYYEDDAYISDSNDQLYAFAWGNDGLLYRYWQDQSAWRVPVARAKAWR